LGLCWLAKNVLWMRVVRWKGRNHLLHPPVESTTHCSLPQATLWATQFAKAAIR
jgi:hypothetical protein